MNQPTQFSANLRTWLATGLIGVLLAISYCVRTYGWDTQQVLSPAGWWLMGEIALGWLIGWIVLWADDRWSQRWYESAPITRSIWFLLVFVALAIYVATSTGSLVGIGLVESMLTWYVLEIWAWQAWPTSFAERYLAGLKTSAALELEAQMAGNWVWLAVVTWCLVTGLVFS
jgi:hypothetical protein